MVIDMTPVEEIKERLNIVDIIGEYVQLKKTGTNHKGLCPFHNETTPSFSVSETKQFFYCFGCGKGGDIFSFLQELERMEFPEVLKILAAKAHVELQQFDKKESNEKTRLIDCITMAAQFFQAALHISKEGSVAREYLAKRGVTIETAKSFDLGYAPDSWDSLYRFLESKNFTTQEIEEAGLLVRSKESRLYDRFRGRLIFPIHNVHGSIVGFTARTLKQEEKSAKYINTPQTKIYNKSGILYGLHEAKKEIQKQDRVVLVEGNMDVVTAHQADILNVVASSGTALTQTQVTLLSRYTKNIILAFDGDAAGMRAVWRGMTIAVKAGATIRVLSLPEGKDPDDVIREDRNLFVAAIEAAQPFMDFAFTTIMDGLDMTQVENKKKVAAELLPMIALFPDPIDQSHYLRRLSEIVEVEMHVLQEKIEPFSSQKKKSESRSASSNAPARTHDTLQVQLQERLLALFLLEPTLLEKNDFTQWFEEPFAALYKKIRFEYNQSQSLNSDELSLLFENFGEESINHKILLIAEEMYNGLSPELLQKEYTTIIDRFLRDSIKQRLQRVQKKLSLAEKSQNKEEIEEYSQEFHLLMQELHRLDQ